MYSSTLSLTSALDGVGGQCHTMAALPPGTTRYPLYRGLSGPQGRSGKVRKISPPPECDPRTAQPVASRHIDWAVPAHSVRQYNPLIFIFVAYLTTSVYQIIHRRILRWLMIRKGLTRKRSWPNVGIIEEFASKMWVKLSKNSFRLADGTVQIRTRHLQKQVCRVRAR